MQAALPGARFQFERHGYFHLDSRLSESKPVWNRIVALRDVWERKG
jgi:hypothetical protein